MEIGRDLKLPIANRSQCFNFQIGWTWNIGNNKKDSDNDGVKDKKDYCPNTDMDFFRSQCPNLKKKKQFVNKHGCHLDDDKDGIHNCYDQCPDTPFGIETDSLGCPLDTDKDGIYDYQDPSPFTPEGVEEITIDNPVDTNIY